MKETKNVKKAFTLAEVLITLSVLGIIAALTIPSLVTRNSDIAAQTKLKKAIATYERVAGAYFTESGKNNLNAWLSDEGQTSCDNADSYFKIVSKNSTNNCEFTTSDGTFWAFNGESGNVVVYDSEKGPRYGVVMWTNDGNVNTSDFETMQSRAGGGGIHRKCPMLNPPHEPTYITDGTTSFVGPVHGYYNAKTFLSTNSSSLSKGEGQKLSEVIAHPTRRCG